jgi:hypothetical protein
MEEVCSSDVSVKFYQTIRYHIPRHTAVGTWQIGIQEVLTVLLATANYRFLWRRTARHTVFRVGSLAEPVIQVWILVSAILRTQPDQPRGCQEILRLVVSWHMLRHCWMCCLNWRRYLSVVCWAQRLYIASVPVGYGYNRLYRARIRGVHYLSDFLHSKVNVSISGYSINFVRLLK